MDHFNLGDRDLLNGQLTVAAERAYRMAGIRQPRKEIDLAKSASPMPSRNCSGARSWDSVRMEKEASSSTAVNADVRGLSGQSSGGVLAMNPYVSRGLYRVIEAAMQIRGRAGEHQVDKKVRTALAHGTHGFAGQCHSVVILEG